jgi:hypothetical protein
VIFERTRLIAKAFENDLLQGGDWRDGVEWQGAQRSSSKASMSA